MCFQCASSSLPVAFQWCSSVFQLCKLALDRHWNTTWCYQQPVWFQWHPSVLVALVVFQCVPIMQINTGSPLQHHWVLASASVVTVVSQCTFGSSGLPVVCPMVFQCTDRIWLGSHKVRPLPSMQPLMYTTGMVRVVWAKLIHLTCNPKYTKTIMVLISKACKEWC